MNIIKLSIQVVWFVAGGILLSLAATSTDSSWISRAIEIIAVVLVFSIVGAIIKSMLNRRTTWR
jgi:CDP-diglyceride synthetase